MPQHRGQCGHLFASWDDHRLCASCRTCSQEDPCNVCRNWSSDLWKRHNTRRLYKAKRRTPNHDWVTGKPFPSFPLPNYGPQCQVPLQSSEGMNFPMNYHNQNSRPESTNSFNMPRPHVMPTFKFVNNFIDVNKQDHCGQNMMPPSPHVWVKRERMEDAAAPRNHTPAVSFPQDDRTVATPTNNPTNNNNSCLSLPADTTSSTSPFAPVPQECDSQQKDINVNPRNSVIPPMPGGNATNMKIENTYTVPIEFPSVGEDDGRVMISMKCLRTLMSLVSCPACQAPVNHQETIQGFKAGTLFCLQLFCYNGHTIQPRW